ncbi:SMC-Scp complex subunit ScpB [Thomasclavelia sp.]
MEETSCLDEKTNYLDIIEGMLYLAGDDGIDIKQVAGVLEISRKDATLLMDQFTQMYENKEMKGIVLVNFGGRYKLATNSEYFIYYQKMVEQSSASLSNAALETLAIIAYNQPITRASVEDIRGVGCDAMIRKLVAKALIKEVGREDSPGMPILYGVTDEFMDTFGLTSLDELPDLADIVEVDDQEDIFATRYREDTDNKIEENNESH